MRIILFQLLLLLFITLHDTLHDHWWLLLLLLLLLLLIVILMVMMLSLLLLVMTMIRLTLPSCRCCCCCYWWWCTSTPLSESSLPVISDSLADAPARSLLNPIMTSCWSCNLRLYSAFSRCTIVRVCSIAMMSWAGCWMITLGLGGGDGRWTFFDCSSVYNKQGYFGLQSLHT